MTIINQFYVLVMLAELALLGILTLALHRLSLRLGLNLLIFFLGSLLAILQSRFLGLFTTNVVGIEARLSIGSYVILPVLLMGLLVIYIINGSTQARNTFWGLILVSLLIALYQSLPGFLVLLPGTLPARLSLTDLSPRIPLSSAATLMIDMVVLVIVYQSVSNWRSRFPSRLASGIALIVALWGDAIFFPIFAYAGTPVSVSQIIVNLLGKSLAGLALWPIVVLYLIWYSPSYPNSAAAIQRPVFDIFATVKLVVNLRDTPHRQLFEHRLLALNQLTTELVQIYHPQELYRLILHACEELLQANASAIALVEETVENITEIHANGLPQECHRQIIEQFSSLLGKDEVLANPILCSEDIEQEPILPEVKSRLREIGLRSIMFLPIHYQGSPLGILGLYFNSSRQFDKTTQQIGITATQTLAITLQNARLYQSEHSQRQFAEAIVQATEVLNSSLDLDQVFDQILEQTLRVVPCQSVNLMLIEGAKASVICQLHRVSDTQIERIAGGAVLPLTVSSLGRMLSTGQPIFIPDTQQDPDWKILDTSAWIRSYASAPLQIRQQVIGFLNVNSNRPNFFNEETTRRLQAFASHAAAALHNARLYRDLQKYSFDLEERVLERTAELSIAKNRIEAILESVPDAVFVLAADEQLLESNQAGKYLLEQAKAGQTELFNQDFMARLISGQMPDEKAITEVNGRIYQALSSSLPLPDKQSGLVVVFRDVTRFQELDRMKNQFVSDVSHELRTPLANLSLYLDLLSYERDDLKRERYQATLRRETNRLTQLIEDLLTISRLESNRISIFIREVEILPLLRDLAEDRTPMALQRNLRLVFTPVEDLPLAMVDPRLLSQVISNVLTNALNYTQPNGLIKLSASAEQSEGKQWVTVTISDTGEGILPEDLPHIFERFYRGAASRKTNAPGTGLGLAISQEIIGQMDGKITVASQPGLGSTFTIWVPAKP